MDWCVFVCCGGEVWGWGVSHCSTVQHGCHNPPSGASGNVWWWCFLLIQIYTAHTCVCLFLVVVMSGYLITGSVERWHKDFLQNIHSHCTTSCVWFSAPCNQRSSARCSFTATLASPQLSVSPTAKIIPDVIPPPPWTHQSLLSPLSHCPHVLQDLHVLLWLPLGVPQLLSWHPIVCFL